MSTKFSLLLLTMLLVLGTSLAQERYTLKGKVLDDDTKEGLIGSTVQVKGTTNGAVADIEGNFQVLVSALDTLQISYLGFDTQQILVNGRTEIEILMSSNLETLEEVIVTGYGAIKKSDLTGAVSSLDVSDINDLPVPDVTQALQGRVAGVQITQNSGAPGDGTAIRIRGTGSINSSSEPLYIVDGVIVSSINYLSQDDIQSLEVMKDASVAALYGARAANGVILIATKQGEKGAPKITFGSQVGFQNFWRVLDMMNTREYRTMLGMQTGGSVSALQVQIENVNNANAEDNDWIDLISRTGVRQKYNLSVSGGADNFTYRFSTNYYNETGILINSDFQRLNLLSDLNFKLTKRIKFRSNVLYSGRARNVQDTGDKQGLLRRAIIDAPFNSILDGSGLPADTPLRKARDQFDKRDISNLQVKLFFDYELAESLKFTSRFGIGQENFAKRIFVPPGINYEIGIVANSAARSAETRTNRVKWSWDQILTFDKKIEDHTVSLTGAFSMERLTYRTVFASGVSSLGRDASTAYLINATRAFNVGGDAFAWSQLGGVFRSSYNYKGKYFLQANMRADGSSRFASDSRWGLFPSASVAWYLSDDLFPKSRVITSAKLRLSYGLLGNNRIGNYETYTILNNSGGGSDYLYVYGSDQNFSFYPGFSPNKLGNPSITWEKTATYDLGLDIDLFGNVFIVADVFRKYTTDLLLNEPVPLSTGLLNSPRRNVGEVINDGIELSINHKRNVGKWSFDISANGTYLINRVEKLGVNDDPVFGGDVDEAIPVDFGFVTKTVVGRPIGSFFGYVVDEINNNPDPSDPNRGRFIFKDLNNDGLITSQDRTFLGSPIPKLTYGFVLNASYSNWDFSFAFQGVEGVSVFNVLRYHTHGYNGTNALSGITENAWRENLNLEGSGLPQDIIDAYSGSNPNPQYPIITTSTNDASYRLPSDFYVEDASYLRLRNATIGYNIPKRVLGRLKIQDCKIYVTAQNLLTWTSYEGFDPEVGNAREIDEGGASLQAGIDYGSYPQGRLFVLGLNMTF